ncbi:TetR/AcrR family transcriptional regulator [Streptococcus panodentis]|uniref:TetR/AcrR family transcriptional regulator n=1 Tax=Streptococcus panodentis TaxID=1581472 RepID=A0ABS5B0D6_9STRE|nr:MULTISPECIES: TetR/AcrR family transcriptional regulator [Streptococcus]KXT84422.1 Transcriptional regulator, TetR family [Streptococcus sp. DD11]MBP2622298.1 TetR/AcrR family transcriptional regulator [Streptococcus panodentis]
MGRRKKEPADAHRKTISEAANTLFTSNSVEATTMDNIAKLAGYSKATLYVYFANKEEIFFYLVYQHTKQLYQDIQNIISNSPDNKEDWTNNYLKICFAISKLCENYPIYFDGMIGNINVDIHSESTPNVYREIYQLGLDLNKLIGLIIEDGIKLNYLHSNLNVNRVVMFLWSALSGIVRMFQNKKEYYQLLGLDNSEFLKDEFLALLEYYKKKG